MDVRVQKATVPIEKYKEQSGNTDADGENGEHGRGEDVELPLGGLALDLVVVHQDGAKRRLLDTFATQSLKGGLADRGITQGEDQLGKQGCAGVDALLPAIPCAAESEPPRKSA